MSHACDVCHKSPYESKKKENILHSWKNLELTGQIHACKKNPHKIIITGKQ